MSFLGYFSVVHYMMLVNNKTLIHADFRYERTLSVGRAVSLLVAKTALLWGLTCHANPTGVAARNENQISEYRKHKFK